MHFHGSRKHEWSRVLVEDVFGAEQLDYRSLANRVSANREAETVFLVLVVSTLCWTLAPRPTNLAD